MKVCQKVEGKGRTTYNEVADELVHEFAAPGALGARPPPRPCPARTPAAVAHCALLHAACAQRSRALPALRLRAEAERLHAGRTPVQYLRRAECGCKHPCHVGIDYQLECAFGPSK